MKREYTVLLAVFFFLAISSLVFIQVRWINSVSGAEDQAFRFGVNDALKEVVLELEKTETYNRIINEINPAPPEDPGDDLSNESEEQSAEARLLEKYGFNPGVRSVIINRAGRTYLLQSDSILSESSVGDAGTESLSLTVGAAARMTSKVVSIENIVSRICMRHLRCATGSPLMNLTSK